MVRALTIRFVAFVPELTRSHDNPAVLCGFSKVVSEDQIPPPGRILEVGGVEFIYEGTPQLLDDGKVVNYPFVPRHSAGSVNLFSRRGATALKLTPEDNEKFAVVRRVFERKHFACILTDLYGRPFH